MRVLIVGKGGREHALAWKISKSPILEELFCLNPNPGMQSLCKASDGEDIISFCKKRGIDLVIIGPENPIAEGLADRLLESGIGVFAPTKKASKLEASKVFAKRLMERYGIPTASFEVFEDIQKAKRFIKDFGAPLVIKADGLAGGKGVFVCRDLNEALEAINILMSQDAFKGAGKKVVIEEFLEGKEASFIVLVNGERFLQLPTALDYKRLLDGDKGPNTGGMGAVSPNPYLNKELRSQVINKILTPLLGALKSEGINYLGFLYIGLMLTKDGPKVLEFNVRLGDPETQAILPRLEVDLLELILNFMQGRDCKVLQKPEACACAVLASEGYPLKVKDDREIKGIETLSQDTLVFHAGTKLSNGKLHTSGGRVLNLCILDKDISALRAKLYGEIRKIYFEGMQYRKDIALFEEFSFDE